MDESVTGGTIRTGTIRCGWALIGESSGSTLYNPFPMPALSIVEFVAGMALLVGGGTWLVDSAVSLARRGGWSELVIGITLVAAGTSAPELAFNVSAAISDQTGLCFGNVVGSNIANIGLVLGIGGIVAPLVVSRRVIRYEMSLLIAASLAFTFAALSWGGEGNGTITRVDGIWMLLAFSACLLLWARTGQIAPEDREEPVGRVSRDVLLLLLGLGCLAGGGRLAEVGAIGIAEAFGASEAFIGLTIVAFATSLPELVTVVIAARRGHTELAVGNVVGSNLFNMMFVLAITSIVRPVETPDGGAIDLIAMLALTIGLLPLCLVYRGRIVRWQAAFLLVGYIAWLTTRLVIRGIG